jgi:hypothetical protein
MGQLESLKVYHPLQQYSEEDYGLIRLVSHSEPPLEGCLALKGLSVEGSDKIL